MRLPLTLPARLDQPTPPPPRTVPWPQPSQLPARLPMRLATTRPARPRLHPGAIFQIPLAPDQPLTADQKLAANLAAQASWTNVPNAQGIRVQYGVPYNITSDGGAYATPFYVTPAGTPRQRVYSLIPRRAPWQQILDAGVPIPDRELLPGLHVGASGTDGSCAIFDGVHLWEFWKLAAAAPGSVAANLGYAWQCNQGGYIDDVTTYQPPVGSQTYATYKGGLYAANWGWGVSASGITILGGRLMAEDYWSGTIAHALVAALPLTGSPVNPPTTAWPTQLPPATRHDVFNFTGCPDALVLPYRIPQGAWFRLPASFDTVAWAASHHAYASSYVVEMVCRAIRDYGLMINDSGAVIGFGCEGANSFGTRYSPWRADQLPPWGHFGQDLPWSQMQQIAARVA